MTVLRSRKVLPAVTFGSPTINALKKGSIEPEALTKTLDSITCDSARGSPNSSASSAQVRDFLWVECVKELDNGSASGLGTGRRRSLRLAAKCGLDENVGCGSSKRVGGCSGGHRRNEPTSDGKDSQPNVSTEILSLSERNRENNWVAADIKGNEVMVQVGKELVLSMSATEVTESREESRLCSDFEISRHIKGKYSSRSYRRKRKVDFDVNLAELRLPGEDMSDGFLSLRSGLRIFKRSVNGDDVTEAKGKGKQTGDTTGKKESESRVQMSSSADASKTTSLLDSLQIKESNEDLDTSKIVASVGTRRRLSKEEKGKAKVEEKNDLVLESAFQRSIGNTVSDPVNSEKDVASTEGMNTVETTEVSASRRRDPKEVFRDVARRNASRFAHFSSQDAEGESHAAVETERQSPHSQAGSEEEDWPGPFSTALKIISDRKRNTNVIQHSSSLVRSESVAPVWVPRRRREWASHMVPSLLELCVDLLARHVDAIATLDFVPDSLRHKICQLLCASRRMNSDFLQLLLSGSPTEIRVTDCSWLTEEQFVKFFEGCDTSKLTVLQFDQCGRCLPDYNLSSTLSRFPNSMQALTTVSLKGAYRLSDDGLRALVSSAPYLQSINLSECSLITADGIDILAYSLGSSLRELYIDECQCIDAMLILPALSNFKHLEVLSIVGMDTVCDDFVSIFIAVCGYNMKELILTGCGKLTNHSFKAIARSCPQLRALDMSNLCKLTDSAMGYLANGCHAIQKLTLCRNPFSDEAVAAYLEARGESLIELSLNNIRKVSNQTAISLARHSRSLRSLDLSWCRNLTDDCLGLIVDSCVSLKMLKLFGCTQVTNVFLDGHSNPQVQIIGLKLTPLLGQKNWLNPLNI